MPHFDYLPIRYELQFMMPQLSWNCNPFHSPLERVDFPVYPQIPSSLFLPHSPPSNNTIPTNSDSAPQFLLLYPFSHIVWPKYVTHFLLLLLFSFCQSQPKCRPSWQSIPEQCPFPERGNEKPFLRQFSSVIPISNLCHWISGPQADISHFLVGLNIDHNNSKGYLLLCIPEILLLRVYELPVGQS